jgi:CheY-like chemotaxis protein
VDTASNGLEATFNEKPNLIRVVDLNKLILHEAFTAENNAEETRSPSRCSDQWDRCLADAERKRYDVILMDVGLPEIDGL